MIRSIQFAVSAFLLTSNAESVIKFPGMGPPGSHPVRLPPIWMVPYYNVPCYAYCATQLTDGTTEALEEWTAKFGPGKLDAVKAQLCRRRKDVRSTLWSIEEIVDFFLFNRSSLKSSVSVGGEPLDFPTSYGCSMFCAMEDKKKVSHLLRNWIFTYGVKNFTSLTHNLCSPWSTLTADKALLEVYECIIYNRMPVKQTALPAKMQTPPFVSWKNWITSVFSSNVPQIAFVKKNKFADMGISKGAAWKTWAASG